MLNNPEHSGQKTDCQAKKSMHKRFGLNTAFAGFMIVCLALLLPFYAHAASLNAAAVISAEGGADVLTAGSVELVPLKTGDAVSVGDILRTKNNGRIKLTFVDQTIVTIGPGSKFKVEEYHFNREAGLRTASLRLLRGILRFVIPKMANAAEGGKFDLNLMTAVAGVRGTEGILSSEGVERVYVKEGLVEFSNPAGSVMVSAGSFGEAMPGQGPVAMTFTEREYMIRERQLEPSSDKTSIREVFPVPTALIARDIPGQERGLSPWDFQNSTFPLQTQVLSIAEVAGFT